MSQFAPDGALHQVEYAKVAVDNSEPAIVVLLAPTGQFAGGIALAARLNPRHPRALKLSGEGCPAERIFRIDDHVAACAAGVGPDAVTLVEVARDAAQRHRITWGKPISLALLCRTVANHMQAFTQRGGLRPFGVTLVLSGYDEENGFQVLSIDPAGNMKAHSAPSSAESAFSLPTVVAVGHDSEKIQSAVLAGDWQCKEGTEDSDGPLQEAHQVIRGALIGDTASNDGGNYSPHLEVATVYLEKGVSTVSLSGGGAPVAQTTWRPAVAIDGEG